MIKDAGAGARGSLKDVPLEFVGEIAGACALAEASHIKCGTAAARHGSQSNWLREK